MLPLYTSYHDCGCLPVFSRCPRPWEFLRYGSTTCCCAWSPGPFRCGSGSASLVEEDLFPLEVLASALFHLQLCRFLSFWSTFWPVSLLVRLIFDGFTILTFTYCFTVKIFSFYANIKFSAFFHCGIYTRSLVGCAHHLSPIRANTHGLRNEKRLVQVNSGRLPETVT